MISRLLLWTSLLASAFIIVGFLGFAYDEVNGASKHQQQVIAGTNTRQDTPIGPGYQPTLQRAPDQQHNLVRREVDHVANALSSPFDGLVTSRDAWADKGIPALLALLIFGLGLGFLSRFSAGRPT